MTLLLSTLILAAVARGLVLRGLLIGLIVGLAVEAPVGSVGELWAHAVAAKAQAAQMLAALEHFVDTVPRSR